ncbi:hypothetical protein AVEN_259231-1 [Araneus ventricosus]|uniref:Uncharacterized protein n=1 Tax=Araneus ventricosus TaxID=182803 RepID=A0A4Y2IGY4_ARAVE|nr:hypothetical protein AVEN_259231-1 [Araneus ventricosus]
MWKWLNAPSSIGSGDGSDGVVCGSRIPRIHLLWNQIVTTGTRLEQLRTPEQKKISHVFDAQLLQRFLKPQTSSAEPSAKLVLLHIFYNFTSTVVTIFTQQG